MVRESLQTLGQEAKQRNEAAGKKFLAENAKRPGVLTTTAGLQYEIIEEKTAPKPTLNDKVVVLYEAKLLGGTIFDSNKAQKEPEALNMAGLIKGLQEGLQLMSAGSTFRLYIPAALGYGDKGAGRVPPASVLIFDLTLEAIK